MRPADVWSVVNSPNSEIADLGSTTSFVNTGQSVRLAGGTTKGRVRPGLVADDVRFAAETCRFRHFMNFCTDLYRNMNRDLHYWAA